MVFSQSGCVLSIEIKAETHDLNSTWSVSLCSVLHEQMFVRVYQRDNFVFTKASLAAVTILLKVVTQKKKKKKKKRLR